MGSGFSIHLYIFKSFIVYHKTVASYLSICLKYSEQEKTELAKQPVRRTIAKKEAVIRLTFLAKIQENLGSNYSFR